MYCPKCGSKTRVLKSTRYNLKDNEAYRHRMCSFKGCGYKFYTVEFMAEEDATFKEQWGNASTTLTDRGSTE